MSGVPRPDRVREPDCVHSHPEFTQPMSACRICQHDPALQRWRDDWAAWLAENPNSPEAKDARDFDSGRRWPV